MLTISVTDVFVACCALGKASGYDSSVKTLFPCLRWSLQSEAGSAGSRFPAGLENGIFVGRGGEAQALDQGPSQGAANFCLRNLRPARFTARGQGNGAKLNKRREQQRGRFPSSVLFLSCRAFPF